MYYAMYSLHAVNKDAAILQDAVANAILPSDQSFAKISFIKNVLFVPPGRGVGPGRAQTHLNVSCALIMKIS